MGRYNFDQLFAGENIDKLKAQNAFHDGIKVLRRDAAKNYARLVLAGEPGHRAFDEVNEYDRVLEVLKTDPRMAGLKEWAEQEELKLREEEIRKKLDDAMNKVFGR